MFERFTDRSRRVLVLAQEEARLLGHSYIGSEHILLGLIGEAGGVAARVLASYGMELDGVRTMIRGHDAAAGPPDSQPPFTEGAKKVLERALREALDRSSSSLGTEDILLGLVTPAEDIVVVLLAQYDVTPDDVRSRTENILHGRPLRTQGVVDRYFLHLSGRDWTSLGAVLAEDVVRVGPLGDEVSGRAPYLELLKDSVPERYSNDVRQVVYASGGTSAFARVTEHLFYPGNELHLEETYAFEIAREVITRVEVFWQSPGVS